MPRKNKSNRVHASERGVECRMSTMKYWEHHYVVIIIDVPFCFCCAFLGGFQKRVIDYQRYHTASKHLAAWPEATACLELCRGLLPLHKQCWNKDHKLGSLCLMLHTLNSDKTETCVQFTQPFLSVFLFVQSFNFRQHTVSLRRRIWMAWSLL